MNRQVARLVDLAPHIVSFRDAVLHGLSKPRKAIPPVYFYDAEGAALFEKICDLPEYYPTRTEIGILRRYAGEIAAAIGPAAHLFEYGSGSAVKVRLLLDALTDPIAYMPVDISGEQLRSVAERLAADYPSLEVTAIIADYTRSFFLPAPRRMPKTRAALFMGSTIGNFLPDDALTFLRQAARLLAGGGALLIGADLRKDPGRLHAAYNDAAGLTAAFNLNLLARINRELNGNFELDDFDHYAFYEPTHGRIEMHLISRRAQQVAVAGREFSFAPGESVHTENSYKFDPDQFRDLACRAGFTPERMWIDDERLFSVHLCGPTERPQ